MLFSLSLENSAVCSRILKLKQLVESCTPNWKDRLPLCRVNRFEFKQISQLCRYVICILYIHISIFLCMNASLFVLPVGTNTMARQSDNSFNFSKLCENFAKICPDFCQSQAKKQESLDFANKVLFELGPKMREIKKSGTLRRDVASYVRRRRQCIHLFVQLQETNECESSPAG